MPTSIRGDFRLDLTQVVLLQKFLKQPSRLRLSWRAQLVNIKDRNVMGTRDFSKEEEAFSENAYGGCIGCPAGVNSPLEGSE